MNNLYKYTTIDGQVGYILSPDSESAAWRAAELSNGTHNLKDVELTNGKRVSQQLARDCRF